MPPCPVPAPTAALYVFGVMFERTTECAKAPIEAMQSISIALNDFNDFSQGRSPELLYYYI